LSVVILQGRRSTSSTHITCTQWCTVMNLKSKLYSCSMLH
jgi:hypothetical protein